jgi:ATP-dependent helicase/nuclease subunit A
MTPDQADRDLARRSLDRNVVVEAGAGTGKTTLLTDRILFLLAAGGPRGEGLDITRVVALTFTEKAGGEIKARLAQRLADLAAHLEGRPLPPVRAVWAVDWVAEAQTHFQKSPAQIKKMAETAFQNLDRSSLGTIHTFAGQILRLHAMDAGVDPAFSVDDGDDRDDLFETEWALWLDRELGAAPPRRDLWRELLPWVALDDLALLAKDLCRDEAEDCRFSSADFGREALALARQTRQLAEGKPPLRGNSKFIERLEKVSTRLEALARHGDIPPGDLDALSEDIKPGDWPKKWEGLPGEDVFDRAAVWAKGASPRGLVTLDRARAAVAPFVARFKDLRARRGRVGFHGLLLKARDLLRDKPAVRRELKARWAALLIDEFQDTDPLQGEIVLYLSEVPEGRAERWRDIRLAPGKLFLVGDPKQSIYRFRGADMEAYQGFTRHVQDQGGLLCRLRTSWRSPEGLIGPLNRLFEKVMTETPGLQPGYIPLTPRPNGRGGEPALTLVRAKASGLSATERRGKEAVWIASWARAHAGPGREWGYGDVALLFRKAAVLTPYLEALKTARVPYVVEMDRSFYSAPEVVDFLNLLRVLEDPEDRVSLVGLLRSPLLLLTDREIYDLARAGDLDFRRAPLGRAGEFHAWLRRFHARVDREPLGDFIGALLRDSFFLELAALAYFGEQTVSNLLKFGRLAREAGDSRGLSLREFTARMVRSLRRSVEEGESPLADERVPAVRLTTIHRAKGLEFPVVFVVDMAAGAGPGPGKQPILRRDWAGGAAGLRLPRAGTADLAWVALDEKEKRREDHERIRLFYVAYTRAREKLFLMGDPGRSGEKSFAEIARQGGLTPEGAPTFPAQVAHLEDLPAPASTPEPDGPSSAPPTDFASLADRWKARLSRSAAIQSARLFLSPSGENVPLGFSEGTLSHPTENCVEHPSPLEGEGAPKGRMRGGTRAGGASLSLGQLCHRALQDWDYQSPADPAPAPAVARAAALLARQTPGADADDLIEEATGILRSFLASPAARQLSTATIEAREADFLLSTEKGILRGALDILVRDDTGLWVGDYKTDRVTAEDVPARATLYDPQGRAYAAAVAKALGEPCGFRLIFLRPGVVQRVF